MKIGERVFPSSRCVYEGAWKSGASGTVVSVDWITGAWCGAKTFLRHKAGRRAFISVLLDGEPSPTIFMRHELHRLYPSGCGEKYAGFGRRAKFTGYGRGKRAVIDLEERRKADAAERLAASGDWKVWPVAEAVEGKW